MGEKKEKSDRVVADNITQNVNRESNEPKMTPFRKPCLKKKPKKRKLRTKNTMPIANLTGRIPTFSPTLIIIKIIIKLLAKPCNFIVKVCKDVNQENQ